MSMGKCGWVEVRDAEAEGWVTEKWVDGGEQ